VPFDVGVELTPLYGIWYQVLRFVIDIVDTGYICLLRSVVTFGTLLIRYVVVVTFTVADYGCVDVVVVDYVYVR